jgi:hypothetical protein
VNVEGLVAMTRVLPDLSQARRARRQHRDASATSACPSGATYASSKWAVISLESLALELELQGVAARDRRLPDVSTGLFDGAKAPRMTRLLTPIGSPS